VLVQALGWPDLQLKDAFRNVKEITVSEVNSEAEGRAQASHNGLSNAPEIRSAAPGAGLALG
jgi:hypothetical protein